VHVKVKKSKEGYTSLQADFLKHQPEWIRHVMPSTGVCAQLTEKLALITNALT